MTFPNIQQTLRKFAEERNWDQIHSPKNLSMALAAETAELFGIFQWLISKKKYSPRSASMKRNTL